jgi:hypothetical protein
LKNVDLKTLIHVTGVSTLALKILGLVFLAGWLIRLCRRCRAKKKDKDLDKMEMKDLTPLAPAQEEKKDPLKVDWGDDTPAQEEQRDPLRVDWGDETPAPATLLRCGFNSFREPVPGATPENPPAQLSIVNENYDPLGVDYWGDNPVASGPLTVEAQVHQDTATDTADTATDTADTATDTADTATDTADTATDTADTATATASNPASPDPKKKNKVSAFGKRIKCKLRK